VGGVVAKVENERKKWMGRTLVDFIFGGEKKTAKSSMLDSYCIIFLAGMLD